ncbi:MAG TPA: adenylate/guanylate cyclase domain-containing protein, partial [bacterium]
TMASAQAFGLEQRAAGRRLPEWLSRLAAVGTLPGDPDDVRLRKVTLTFSVGMITLAGFLWGTMYVALGQDRSALFPYAYSVCSLLNIAALAIWKRYGIFRFLQIFFILWLPYLLQWHLGGFVASGAVMIWALLAPIGALLFDNPRAAITWFIAYLGLAVFSAAIESSVEPLAPPFHLAVRVGFFALNLGTVSTVVFLLLRYFVREVGQAQDRSERLLLNILPRAIADRLKHDPGTIAETVPEVTVLFADIVNFTGFSAELTAKELVRLLNDVFSAFDRLADAHGLEKIKTIGDAYMAVAGLPGSTRAHAEAAVEMALELHPTLDQICRERGTARLQLRIGLNTGPVVAGVIGRRKFSFDLWGDAVNTASRMESHGLPGRIQVTQRTYECLRADYEFEPRGPVEIKGKGLMSTYLLVGRRKASATDAAR